MLPVRAERIIKGIEADKLRERTRQGQRFGKWFGKCGSTQERVHKADGTASPARPPDEAGPWLGSRDLDLGRAPTTQTARGGLLYLNCASHVAYAKARLPLGSPARRYVLAQSTCPAPERIPRQGLLGASLGGCVSHALSQLAAGGFQYILGETTGGRPAEPGTWIPLNFAPFCLSLSDVALYRFTVINHGREEDYVPVNHHTWVCVCWGPRFGGWGEKDRSAGHPQEVSLNMARLSKSLTWKNKEDLKKDNEVGIMLFDPVIPFID